MAIRYATFRLDGLTFHLDHGRAKMALNTVERSIRPLALIRNKVLLAGSDRGGSHGR